jgi:hypothetical protein
MPDDLIHCPSCGFQLGLPTHLYGSSVQCPQCHVQFTAPVPRPQGQGPIAADQSHFDDYHSDAKTPGGGPLTAPAIALLVFSVLSAVMSLLGLAWANIAQQNPAAFDKALKQQLDSDPDMTPQERQDMEDLLTLENVVRFLHLDCGISLAANLVTALGAIQMLRRRTYWLAVLACVFALNPANIPCCAAQFPVGIWGLIALISQSGRRAFR